MDICTKQIIISGPPGAGKSTLISELAKKGEKVLPELARRIIIEERENGLERWPWTQLNAFSHLVFDGFMEQRKNYHKPRVFTDRAIPDTLAYMTLGNLNHPKPFTEALKHYPYHPCVYFAPFWKEIYTQDDNRLENTKQAMAVETALIDTYKHYGFRLVILPKLDAEKRAQWLLNHLENHAL